jgi:hypothetical protein
LGEIDIGHPAITLELAKDLEIDCVELDLFRHERSSFLRGDFVREGKVEILYLLMVGQALMVGDVDRYVPYPGAAATISIEIVGKARSPRVRSSRVGAWPSAARSRWNQARPAFNPICFSSKVNPREISSNPLDNKQSRRLFAGKWRCRHRSGYK